jgi:hypothetical protein
MKIKMYVMCFAMLGGFQLHASQPAAQHVEVSSPKAGSEAGWTVVKISPKTLFKQLVQSALLQMRAAQIESMKKQLAEAQSAVAFVNRTFGSIAQACAKEHHDALVLYQNHPSRYSLFPWESA